MSLETKVIKSRLGLLSLAEELFLFNGQLKI